MTCRPYVQSFALIKGHGHISTYLVYVSIVDFKTEVERRVNRVTKYLESYCDSIVVASLGVYPQNGDVFLGFLRIESMLGLNRQDKGAAPYTMDMFNPIG